MSHDPLSHRTRSPVALLAGADVMDGSGIRPLPAERAPSELSSDEITILRAV